MYDIEWLGGEDIRPISGFGDVMNSPNRNLVKMIIVHIWGLENLSWSSSVEI